MKTMLTDTSDLDSLAGIRYRNMTLREVNAALPKSVGSTIGLSEGLFWLLLTGEIPNMDIIQEFTIELHSRSQLPKNVITTIDNLP